MANLTCAHLTASISLGQPAAAVTSRANATAGVSLLSTVAGWMDRASCRALSSSAA
jgi:hypothetical protein